jgi:hypothetical protein
MFWGYLNLFLTLALKNTYFYKTFIFLFLMDQIRLVKGNLHELTDSVIIYSKLSPSSNPHEGKIIASYGTYDLEKYTQTFGRLPMNAESVEDLQKNILSQIGKNFPSDPSDVVIHEAFYYSPIQIEVENEIFHGMEDIFFVGKHPSLGLCYDWIGRGIDFYQMIYSGQHLNLKQKEAPVYHLNITPPAGAGNNTCANPKITSISNRQKLEIYLGAELAAENYAAAAKLRDIIQKLG